MILHRLVLALVGQLAVFAPAATQPSSPTLSTFRQPTLEQAQRAAIRRAQLDPARARRWLRATRRSAALPRLELSWDHDYGRGWQHDLQPGEPDELQSGHDAGDQWRVKLTWELDRLWFNPDELRAARTAADLARWREELLIEVTRLYFEAKRNRLRASDPESSPSEREQCSSQAQELEGLLSGLTGLRWSQSRAQSLPVGGSGDI